MLCRDIIIEKAEGKKGQKYSRYEESILLIFQSSNHKNLFEVTNGDFFNSVGVRHEVSGLEFQVMHISKGATSFSNHQGQKLQPVVQTIKVNSMVKLVVKKYEIFFSLAIVRYLFN